MEKITLNADQNLFVFNNGTHVSCLGFKVCLNRRTKLAKELGEPINEIPADTLESYHEYVRLVDIAHKKHTETGWRSQSELIPEFIGREGQRVETESEDGSIERFYIGKSTGFIPCHLMIKKSNSSGGMAVYGYPFKRITFLSQRR